MTMRALFICFLMGLIGCDEDADTTSEADGHTPGNDAAFTDSGPQMPEGTDASGATPNTDALVMSEDAGSSSTLNDQGQTAPPSECVVVPQPGLCNPDAPDNDRVGMVCFADGTPEESYCHVDSEGLWVCARSADGGPCEGDGDPVPEPEPTDPDAGTFMVRDIADGDPLKTIFSREVSTFGIRIVGTDRVPVEKLQHAATIAAEYLDNNEDGQADDAAVVESLQQRRALLVMFANSRELESSSAFNSSALDGFHIQDLQADETAVPGRFDATLEEVLHLIQTAGYARVYPMAFGENPGSRLADAMDRARGGRFQSVPAEYPEGSWYHYDDVTCTYRCMVVEYFYWGLTTLLGAQAGGDRCAEIRREWEVCTAEQLMRRDPALHELLTDERFNLPSALPDGRYGEP